MDSSVWEPEEIILNYTLQFLQDSLVPDSSTQKSVQEKANNFRNNPDCLHYMLHILSKKQSYEQHIRALSGIMLKNLMLETNVKITPNFISYLKQESLRLLRDESRDVRNTVTTLISAIVWQYNISTWPELMPFLCHLSESNDTQMCETALNALFKVCDSYLSKRSAGQHDFDESVNAVLAKFVNFVTHAEAFIRKESIILLNQVMQDNCEAVKKYLDAKRYMTNLLQVFDNDSNDTRRYICQAFLIFVENRDVTILPFMDKVIDCCLQASQSGDDDLALQASEFWLAVANLPVCREMLSPYVGQLVTVLLNNMKYSQFELEALKDHVGDDDHLEDRVEDVRPFGMRLGISDYADDDSSSLSGDGDHYGQTDALGESYVGWTLRKCSAASLDTLSINFRDDILPVILPLLKEALASQDYLEKEAGILALGAISDGCLNGLRPYLPELYQFLMSCFSDDMSIIRVITCWTLSRYMSWIMEAEQSHEIYFVPTMTSLLKHFLDGNKKVQRAALSAFCIFQEEARTRLVPYIEFILQAFLLGFKKHKFRSNLLLYDSIGVLAQSVGNNLSKQEYADLLLPPLMQRFSACDSYEDDQFLALLECLSNVVSAVEMFFLPYAEIVFNRCLTMINHIIGGVVYFNENQDDYDVMDKDALFVAFDVLQGMAIGLKSYFVKFVTSSNLLSQMHYTMQDSVEHVRQSSLALYGELVKLCYAYLDETIHEYLPIIIENLDKRFDGACNNAAWVVGKLCMAMGSKIDPYCDQILAHMVEIMIAANGCKPMYQTVAISLCVLGIVCPDKVVPHLPSVLRSCCQAIRNVRDCEEKELGFRGLCSMILCNPPALVNDFIYFCDAVASWNSIRSDLKEVIVNILLAFRTQMGDQTWGSYYGTFPPMLKLRLSTLYGV